MRQVSHGLVLAATLGAVGVTTYRAQQPKDQQPAITVYKSPT